MERLEYIISLGDNATLLAWAWVLQDYILMPIGFACFYFIMRMMVKGLK